MRRVGVLVFFVSMQCSPATQYNGYFVQDRWYLPPRAPALYAHMQKINVLSSDKQKVLTLCFMVMCVWCIGCKTYNCGKFVLSSGSFHVTKGAKDIYAGLIYGVRAICHRTQCWRNNWQHKRHERLLKKIQNNSMLIQEIQRKKNNFVQRCGAAAQREIGNQKKIHAISRRLADTFTDIESLGSYIDDIDNQQKEIASASWHYCQAGREQNNEIITMLGNNNEHLANIISDADRRLHQLGIKFKNNSNHGNTAIGDVPIGIRK